MLSRLIPPFFLILSFYANTAFAQYEGEIRFNINDPDNFGNKTVQMDMTFTKNRIYIGSNVSLNVMAGLRVRGVLVRHDLQDFVMITTDEEGLKVAKSELESLVNLLNSMQGRQDTTGTKPFPWEERVSQTGKQRKILGYNTQQFILNSEKNGEYVSVWLTDEIHVNWGLMQEAWYTIGAKQIDQEIPIELVMNRESFPLLVEAYENNQVVFRAQSVYANDSSFDRSKTELPSNLKLMGLTDLMMNMFRQN